MPAIIAHRGASLEAPENTIRAFERAIGIGVDRIELDLRRTADGGIVVIHDEELQRLCEDPRKVSSLTAAEVRSLQVLAGEFGSGPNMRVPDFEEVVDRIAPRCPLYIEIKTDADADPEEFTDQVLDLVPNGTVHRISSFDPRVVLRALRSGHPAVLIARALDALEAVPAEFRPKLSALSLHHLAIDGTALDHTRDLGIQLWAWTVDEPEGWDRLQKLGALDAWCTNDPRGLRGWLRGRGFA